MTDDTASRNGTILSLSLLAALFIGLKLGHVINWSWWIVLLPAWGFPAFIVLMVIITIPFVVLNNAGGRK